MLRKAWACRTWEFTLAHLLNKQRKWNSRQSSYFGHKAIIILSLTLACAHNIFSPVGPLARIYWLSITLSPLSNTSMPATMTATVVVEVGKCESPPKMRITSRIQTHNLTITEMHIQRHMEACARSEKFENSWYDYLSNSLMNWLSFGVDVTIDTDDSLLLILHHWFHHYVAFGIKLSIGSWLRCCRCCSCCSCCWSFFVSTAVDYAHFCIEKHIHLLKFTFHSIKWNRYH